MLLATLLRSLLCQQTHGLFTYSIIVADNDFCQSAREPVQLIQRDHPGVIRYLIEPQQNIALARNLAVRQADSEYLAFIDDDEAPIDSWLFTMYNVLLRYNADGVLGPVIPQFEIQPPKWVLKSRLFERPRHKTGFVLKWTQTRTGNVLIRRHPLEQLQPPFRCEFGSGGEDRDFFRRAIALGNVFVWCEEAPVYEIVPAARTRVSFQLRRALLRGKTSLSNPCCLALEFARSLVACMLYAILLPFLFLIGRHLFVKYLIKLFDHLGRLLSIFGIDVIKDKYIVS